MDHATVQRFLIPLEHARARWGTDVETVQRSCTPPWPCCLRSSALGRHAVGGRHAGLPAGTRCTLGSNSPGINVYAPWKLFFWWLAFDRQAPEVFASAGALAAVGGLLSGAVALGGAAWRASHKSSATTYGSARWADSSDVRKANLLGDRGVVLGRYGDRYLRHDGPEHVMAFAPTRSGKGVGLVCQRC